MKCFGTFIFTAKASQDQYAMWAAYYAQYYAQGGTGNGSPGGGGSAAAAGASQDPEEVYRQWIEYYKAYGAHKEAEAMEQKLFEYQQSKKVSWSLKEMLVDLFSLFPVVWRWKWKWIKITRP